MTDAPEWKMDLPPPVLTAALRSLRDQRARALAEAAQAYLSPEERPDRFPGPWPIDRLADAARAFIEAYDEARKLENATRTGPREWPHAP